MEMKAMKKILIGLVIASLFLSIPQKIMAAEYLVTFVVNGGDKSSQPEALHLTSGATFNVDDISIPTRSGYDFIGWKFNNEIVSGMMTMPDSAVRLVAQWQGKGQSVVFDFLLTDVGNKQPDYSVGLDEVIQTSNFLVPTHSRYTFLGWTINGKDIVTEVTVRNGGMRLIAKWGGSYEEIHFDVAGGIAPISLGTRQIAVGEMLDLATIPQPTRQGYSFSGWAESDNVIVHNYQVKELGTTFFAQWQEIYDSLSITVQHTERSIEASKDKPNIEDLFGVSAEDLYDGNVSENVMYKLEGIDFTKVGVYPIEISVRNFRNQLLRKTVSLKIVDTTAPTIVVEHEERELKIGDSQLSDYGKLFGVGVTDIVDKNVVADFEEVDSVDKQRPGKYKIRITAEDSSGNRRTKDVLLVLQPIEIAGVVFLDENYNSLKDDLQVVPEVSLQLVDGETKKVLQIVRTNGKGEYRFTTPVYSKKEKTISSFNVRAMVGTQYLLANMNSYGSKFSVESKMTELIIPRGVNDEVEHLGVGKNIEVTLPKQQVELVVGEKQVVDIVVSNGKILGVKGEDDSALAVEVRQMGVVLMTSEKRTQELRILFENRYGRESEIIRKIAIL